jgi:cyclopropane fatty-acyl-phospholipid synthase-like methyltransferase
MLQKIRFNLAYFQKPVWDTGISPQELTSFIATHQPGKALDLGCGTGTNVITLAKSGWRVTGVDFVPRAIRAAKQKAQRLELDVELLVDDVTQLYSISDCFDLILDMGCFHGLTLKDHQKYLVNIERLLAPKGTYLLYAFFKSMADEQGPGITENDITSLTKKLKLIQRVNGSERGIRQSAWLSFKKPG